MGRIAPNDRISKELSDFGGVTAARTAEPGGPDGQRILGNFHAAAAAGGAVSASSGHSTPLEPGEALEVIGKVGHSDLDGGPGDTDGAHDSPIQCFCPANTCST